MKTLRKRAFAKALRQKYKTTKNGCIITDEYGSTEFPCVISNNDFVVMVKLHVKVKKLG